MIKKEEKRVCVACKKDIKDNDNYFSVREFKNRKQMRESFCHKTCQDKYDAGIKISLATTKVLSDLGEHFMNLNQGHVKEVEI